MSNLTMYASPTAIRVGMIAAVEYARLYVHVSHGAAMRFAMALENDAPVDVYDTYIENVGHVLATKITENGAAYKRARKAARKMMQQPFHYAGAYRGDMAAQQNCAAFATRWAILFGGAAYVKRQAHAHIAAQRIDRACAVQAGHVLP